MRRWRGEGEVHGRTVQYGQERGSQENQGSGDRNISITGYVVWLSATAAAHSSQAE